MAAAAVPEVAEIPEAGDDVAVEVARFLDLERLLRGRAQVPSMDGTPRSLAVAAAKGAGFLAVEAGAEEDLEILYLSAARSATMFRSSFVGI